MSAFGGSRLLLCNLTFSRVAQGTQPVFMWCRMLDVGAHQACCPPLLQALFMTVRAPPTMRTIAVRIINIGVFIAASLMRCPKAYRADFPPFKMNAR
jgi:hypothetical protein